MPTNFDDILNEAEDLEVSENVSQNITSGKIDDDILNYQILPDDNILVSSTKNLINERKIKKSEVYEIFGRVKGYNMIYQLSKGVLSWNRLEEWAIILKVEPQLVFSNIKD